MTSLILLLALVAIAQVDDTGLNQELRMISSTRGLALARAWAGSIVVVPFDGPEIQLEMDTGFPIVVFGRAGVRLFSLFRRGFGDIRGTVRIESLDGHESMQNPSGIAGATPVAFSEKSGHVAFFASRTPKGESGLYWATSAFSKSRFIDHSTGYPDWSPDGHMLVYAKNGEINVVDVSDLVPRRLCSGGSPTWSPDGNTIAYIAPTGEASLIEVNGTVLRWALTKYRPSSAIRWSPDGKYVSFSELIMPEK